MDGRGWGWGVQEGVLSDGMLVVGEHLGEKADRRSLLPWSLGSSGGEEADDELAR